MVGFYRVKTSKPRYMSRLYFCSGIGLLVKPFNHLTAQVENLKKRFSIIISLNTVALIERFYYYEKCNATLLLIRYYHGN